MASSVPPAPSGTRSTNHLEQCHAEGKSVALLATSVDNAIEIAELTERPALDLLCQQQKLHVYRMADRARVVRATSAGGMLIVVTADTEAGLPAVVAEVAERLRQPLLIGRHQVWPLVSVGARICRPTVPLDGLARQAHGALATARSVGSGTVRWWEPGGEDDAHNRMAVVNDLAAALDDDEQLTLHFQPLRELRRGAVMGAEALLRWQHPRLGTQSALDTVETAERSGMMGRLGHKVLDLALRQLAAWLPVVAPEFRLHVNVSPTELRSPGYVDRVEDLLGRHGVPASRLLLEITESAAVTGHRPAVAALQQLTERGISVGIDDFGTGYSSIAYLSELPIDTVKVDRSLLAGVVSSSREYELAGAVARLLSVMSVRVVAEGVESSDQLTALRELGYQYGQGYHLGRPAPAELVTPTLRHDVAAPRSARGPAHDWRHSPRRPA